MLAEVPQGHFVRRERALVQVAPFGLLRLRVERHDLLVALVFQCVCLRALHRDLHVDHGGLHHDAALGVLELVVGVVDEGVERPRVGLARRPARGPDRVEHRFELGEGEVVRERRLLQHPLVELAVRYERRVLIQVVERELVLLVQRAHALADRVDDRRHLVAVALRAILRGVEAQVVVKRVHAHVPALAVDLGELARDRLDLRKRHAVAERVEELLVERRLVHHSPLLLRGRVLVAAALLRKEVLLEVVAQRQISAELRVLGHRHLLARADAHQLLELAARVGRLAEFARLLLLDQAALDTLLNQQLAVPVIGRWARRHGRDDKTAP